MTIVLVLSCVWAVSILGLAGIVVWQQRYFMKHITTLTDKIMAGSFQSYTNTINPPPRPMPDPGIPDDLRPLNEFLG